PRQRNQGRVLGQRQVADQVPEQDEGHRQDKPAGMHSLKVSIEKGDQNGVQERKKDYEAQARQTATTPIRQVKIKHALRVKFPWATLQKNMGRAKKLFP